VRVLGLTETLSRLPPDDARTVPMSYELKPELVSFGSRFAEAEKST